MEHKFKQYRALFGVTLGLVVVFVARTLLAMHYPVPRFDNLFTVGVVLGSLAVLARSYRSLCPGDWIASVLLGGLVGGGMLFATLFNAYPFFGLVNDNRGQALIRGLGTAVAALGGLAIMRQGGPVRFHTKRGEGHHLAKSLAFGVAIGLPLAILNVIALQFTEGHPIQWQSPFAALLDALQPGIVEEVIYRFALLGLLWLALRRSLPRQAPLFAGLLALLVHTYMHFDDLFLQAPLTALIMGAVMSLLWGVPLTLLALKRDLDSAFSFHWIQDVARFLAGF